MRLLNEVERLPIVFFHPDVEHLELGEAMTAFSGKREYTDVQPFVNRFDQTVDLSASPATRIFMNYSLGEAVWDLYCYGALKGLESYAPTLKQLMAADRALTKPPTLKAHFIKMIERKLKDYGTTFSPHLLRLLPIGFAKSRFAVLLFGLAMRYGTSWSRIRRTP